jgi:hypothetical protein
MGATCSVHLILLDLIMEKERSSNKQIEKERKKIEKMKEIAIKLEPDTHANNQ